MSSLSSFQPIRRATLLYPSGPANDPNRNHLFVLLTDPIADPLNGGKVCSLLCGLSTVYPTIYHDPTCILQPGDHPFITRNSFVFYAESRVVEAAKLVNGVAQGSFVAKPMMNSAVVDRICAGVLVSIHTPPKAQRFYKIYLGQSSGTP